MSIAKVDIDRKLETELLKLFMRTRFLIVFEAGYTLKNINHAETEKGYHFWFWLKERLSDKELCDLQFLLGDDIKRCRFNYLREEAGVFGDFNALFSKKIKGGDKHDTRVCSWRR